MFTKYHGCGNDFIIGPYIEGTDYPSSARKVCNRFTGIGASASYVIMRLKNLCNEKVKIYLQNGEIEVSSKENKVYMEGPSVCIARDISINL